MLLYIIFYRLFVTLSERHTPFNALIFFHDVFNIAKIVPSSTKYSESDNTAPNSDIRGAWVKRSVHTPLFTSSITGLQSDSK